MNVKKILSIALAVVLSAGVLSGCGGGSGEENKDTSTTESKKIRVGASITPHSEILEKAKPILAEKGIDLEIVKIEDVVTPNTGVVEGSLDANFFQHQPYLDDFNKQNKANLVSIGKVHYEPFGIYAGKVTSLDALPEGAVVAVPNNTTNEARALLLLEQDGIIKLKEDAGIQATVNDIAENPKKITFKEIDPAQLVRALPDVDVAVINGNYAIEGGLKVSDALAVESDQGVAAQTYANIVVVREEDKEKAELKTLVEVLEGDEIQKYIKDTYNGAVVPIK